MKKTLKLKRIQELQNRLDDLEAKDPIGSVERLLEEEESKARKSVSTPAGGALKVLARGLANVQGDKRPQKMMRDLKKAKEEAQQSMEQLSETFQEQLASLLEEVRSVEGKGKQLTESKVEDILGRLAEYEGTFSAGMQELSGKDSALEQEVTQLAGELGVLYEKFNNLPDHAPFLVETAEGVSRVTTNTEELKEALDKLEKRLNSRINNIRQGGGNMNRNILVGGNADTLSYFTDINLKAGSNVTITYSPNQATKYTDITIAATGGSGSTRSVNNISTNTAAGTAAGTDYVYICTGTITVTLPATVGNDNLYTIKNAGTGVISIATTGGDTIDAQPSIQLGTQYTSVDLISDGVNNWNIT